MRIPAPTLGRLHQIWRANPALSAATICRRLGNEGHRIAEPTAALYRPYPQLLRSFIQIPSARMVALLLLQQWIVPDGQGAEHRRDLCWGPLARPTHQILLYPRIAFEGPGRAVGATDMREYALYLWHRQPDGSWCPPRPTVLRRLNWATGELL